MGETRVKILKLILVLTLINSVYSSPASKTKTTVGFGKKCNNDHPICDSNKNLKCSGGTCGCSHKDMTYDKEKDKCVVKKNKSCLIPAGNSTKTITLECKKNTYCDDQGSCVPQGVFGENCLVSKNCREDLGLICEKGTCQCHSNYVEVWNECVGKAERPCFNDKCTTNSYCVTNDVTSKSTTAKTVTPVNYCKCERGYYPTIKGLCEKNYGTECSDDVKANKTCKSWLKCGKTGFCECLEPENHIFDELKGTCVAKIKEKCNANGTHDFNRENQVVCVFGGECVKTTFTNPDQVNNSHSYHCQCKENFAENEYGTCDLAFGSPCKERHSSFVIGDIPHLRCNPKMKLACINGKCDCRESLHIFDEEEKVCVGLDGASCVTPRISRKNGDKSKKGDSSKDKDTPAKADGGTNAVVNDSYLRCTKGAICGPIENGAGDGNGVCKCTTDKLDDGRCEQTSSYPSDIHWVIIMSATVAVFGVVFLMCYMHIKKQGYLANVMF